MNKIKLNDSQLVSQYIKGNEFAFEKLVNRHKNKIFTKIYLIVRDKYVAEDLLQETFIKAVNTIKAGKYNEEGKFLPWIMRIANNMAIDHFRREKRYPTIVMEDGSPLLNNIKFSEESFEVGRERKETHKLVRTLIKELPESQKQVLIMRHYMKMSFQEIADATGVSINTALGRMRYALINMKKKMDKLSIAYDKNLYPG
ncbi:RNA polymerase sigma factor [Marinigracilibium pacificum]|uniref:RNA polymerase sigma factor n=1 Tax=Marinigracilibium pacificum TaxID=2729599 RepID=A0A848IRH3_9BACT|nr:RNA polymerase sigma factor [Marinigracilibium pacificum]NMM47073.1 RNA polymerase sigma factor [Marinigracilibium pacificum]